MVVKVSSWERQWQRECRRGQVAWLSAWQHQLCCREEMLFHHFCKRKHPHSHCLTLSLSLTHSLKGTHKHAVIVTEVVPRYPQSLTSPLHPPHPSLLLFFRPLFAFCTSLLVNFVQKVIFFCLFKGIINILSLFNPHVVPNSEIEHKWTVWMIRLWVSLTYLTQWSSIEWWRDEVKTRKINSMLVPLKIFQWGFIMGVFNLWVK